jgi:signal transduction histidine kinase
VGRGVAVAFGVVVLIFLGFEVIERLWLQEVQRETLQMLYRLRGLTASLIAAALAGWLIVRSSPPLLATALSTEAWTRGDRPTDDERLANYAHWFVLMRWVAVAVAGALVFVVVRVAELLPAVVWWPLVATVAALAGLNVLYTIWIRRRKVTRPMLAVQAYGDIAILIVLLHFSGGIENPLSPLLLFHVIIAGIVLSRRQCYAVAGVATFLLAAMASAEAAHVIPHYTLGIFPHVEAAGHLVHAAHQPLFTATSVGLLAGILFLTAYFVTTLSDRIRHSERQLEEFADTALAERQLMEQALATTGTGLCVCGPSHGQHWVNQRWEEWFGDVSVNDVCACEDDNGYGPACRTVREGIHSRAEVEIEAGGDGQGGRVFQITTAPIRDKDGTVVQAASLAQDFTAQREARERMLQACRLAAVGELAGQVAHEVNNPIAIISAKSRLLLSDRAGEMSEKVAEELGKITDAADRVAQIAQGLLSYCRPSPATRAPMDVSLSIRQALSMVEQRAADAGITIDMEIPDELPLVTANAGEMQQVFLNLLLNAVDAMPDGGRLRIAARVEPEGTEEAGQAWLVFTVSDTGPGICGHVRDKIFEPFFTTKAEGRGAGLGLPICVGLLRSHGGTLALEDSPGGGARAVVRLPARVPQAEPNHA